MQHIYLSLFVVAITLFSFSTAEEISAYDYAGFGPATEQCNRDGIEKACLFLLDNDMGDIDPLGNQLKYTLGIKAIQRGKSWIGNTLLNKACNNNFQPACAYLANHGNDSTNQTTSNTTQTTSASNKAAQLQSAIAQIKSGNIEIGMTRIKYLCEKLSYTDACDYIHKYSNNIITTRNEPGSVPSAYAISDKERELKGAEVQIENGNVEQGLARIKYLCDKLFYADACNYLKKYYQSSQMKEVDKALGLIDNDRLFEAIGLLNDLCEKNNQIACQVINNTKQTEAFLCVHSSNFDENRSKNPTLDKLYDIATGNLNDSVMQSTSPTYNDVGLLTLIMGAAALGGKAIEKATKLVDSDTIICAYRVLGKNDSASKAMFERKLKNGDVVPVYLLDGLVSKSVDRDSYSDVKAKGNAFEFSINTIKSNLAYFGFEFPKEKKIKLWKVDNSKKIFEEVRKYDWDILNKYF